MNTGMLDDEGTLNFQLGHKHDFKEHMLQWIYQQSKDVSRVFLERQDTNHFPVDVYLP